MICSATCSSALKKLLDKEWGMRILIYCLGMVWLGCQGGALVSAEKYLAEGENDKAYQKLNEALLKDPQNPEIHFLKGKVAALKGDYASMNSAFKKVSGLSVNYDQQIDRIRDKHWTIEYNQGVAEEAGEKRELQAAGQFFRRAIAIDPVPLAAWRKLAFVLYRQDSLEVATRAYEHIIARDHADSSALVPLGALYLEQKHYPEAVEVFTKLVEWYPEQRNAHLNLGLAYEKLEQFAAAQNIYQKVLVLDPKSPEGHYNIGNMYWNQRQYEKAIEAYKMAVELSPDDNNLLYSLAVSHLSTEDWDAALPLLQELAERMQDNPLIWNELGRIYALKGWLEKSKEAYEEARGLMP